jgi:hypothetical protein
MLPAQLSPLGSYRGKRLLVNATPQMYAQVPTIEIGMQGMVAERPKDSI